MHTEKGVVYKYPSCESIALILGNISLLVYAFFAQYIDSNSINIKSFELVLKTQWRLGIGVSASVLGKHEKLNTN